MPKKVATPKLAYQADPIRETLQLLGRKWTLLIIRDIAFLKLQRFGEILRNNPGLTPRILSRRLDQMTKEGLAKKQRTNGYSLTPKGEDAVYILLAILRYGIRHCMSEDSERQAIRESDWLRRV
jgi:DNA-binding HxlR family transcriptional regulator